MYRACGSCHSGYRAFTWALVVAAGAWTPAAAQSTTASHSIQLLPRVSVSFALESLDSADRRFRWLGDLSSTVDLVHFPAGRVSLAVDYEAVLGRERRLYDLNQGHYFFELAAARQFRATELAVVVQHVSRHLADREFEGTISWNQVGGRLEYRGLPRLTAALDVKRVWHRRFVDYRWTSRLRLAYAHPVRDRLSWFATGAGDFVDGRDPERAKGTGLDLEAGVRLAGEAAALELFASYERRLDAFPTERRRVRWTSVGFRIGTQ